MPSPDLCILCSTVASTIKGYDLISNFASFSTDKSYVKNSGPSCVNYTSVIVCCASHLPSYLI